MILGIDPGATGAIAVLSDEGYLIRVEDLPHIPKAGLQPAMVAEWLREVDDVKCAFIERVAARPGAGVSGMFNFGRDYGVLLGVLGALAIPYALVTPAKWKADLRLTKDKNLSRARAAELWPGAAAQFSRKKDDGRAEAALIGLWGARYGKG